MADSNVLCILEGKGFEIRLKSEQKKAIRQLYEWKDLLAVQFVHFEVWTMNIELSGGTKNINKWLQALPNPQRRYAGYDKEFATRLRQIKPYLFYSTFWIISFMSVMLLSWLI